MGRHLGAFSPLALERLTVHKAGFEARYGSQVAGIVAVEHDLSAMKPFSGALMVDPVSTNGRLTYAFKRDNGQEGTIMVAMRGNNWGTYEDRDVRSLLTEWSGIDPLVAAYWVQQPVSFEALNTIDHNLDVEFSDFHVASRFRLSPFHVINASVYRAVNELGSFQSVFHSNDNATDPFLMFSQSGYSWLNWGSQIRHSWLLGARSVLTTQLRGSWHNSDLEYFAFFEMQDPFTELGSLANNFGIYQDSLMANLKSSEENQISELSAQVNLYHSISSSHHLEMGLEAAYTDSRFSFFQPFVDPFQTQPSNGFWAGYVQSTLSVGPRMVVTPGLRLTYVPVLSTVYAEPRMAWRIDGPSEWLGTYALRLSGGVYRQYVNQLEITGYGTSSVVPSAYFWLPLDGSHAPARSYHLAMDAMALPAQNWTLRAEAYIKWLHRALNYDHVRAQDLEADPDEYIAQADFLTSVKGRAAGIGASIGYEGDDIGGSASYEFSHTTQQFPGRFEGQQISVPWEVPHRIRLNGKVRLTPFLQFESTWTQNWGRSWGFRRGYYDVFALWEPNIDFSIPNFDAPDEDALPSIKRLDMGLTFSWKNRGYQSRLQLFVLNVLDHENLYDYGVEIQAAAFSQVPRRLPGRQVTASLRMDF